MGYSRNSKEIRVRGSCLLLIINSRWGIFNGERAKMGQNCNILNWQLWSAVYTPAM